jgi:putative ABC transport system substrate-binding protein
VLALKVDVVFAADPYAIRAVTTATRTVPIVGYDLETDPVEAGWVKSLARPGGNVTGVFLDLPEFSGKQVQLLAEAVPRLRRLAILWDRTLATALFRATEAAASRAGLALQSLGVTRSDEIDGAFEMARAQRAEALVILTSPLFLPWSRFAELALRHRLPAIRGSPEFAEAGGLMGYGPARLDRRRLVGGYVDRILRGARPADLPVQRPATFEFVINRASRES